MKSLRQFKSDNEVKPVLLERNVGGVPHAVGGLPVANVEAADDIDTHFAVADVSRPEIVHRLNHYIGLINARQYWNPLTAIRNLAMKLHQIGLQVQIPNDFYPDQEKVYELPVYRFGGAFGVHPTEGWVNDRNTDLILYVEIEHVNEENPLYRVRAYLEHGEDIEMDDDAVVVENVVGTLYMKKTGSGVWMGFPSEKMANEGPKTPVRGGTKISSGKPGDGTVMVASNKYKAVWLDESLDAELDKGLKGWITDYKTQKKAGNTKGASETMANIKKKMIGMSSKKKAHLQSLLNEKNTINEDMAIFSFENSSDAVGFKRITSRVSGVTVHQSGSYAVVAGKVDDREVKDAAKNVGGKNITGSTDPSGLPIPLRKVMNEDTIVVMPDEDGTYKIVAGKQVLVRGLSKESANKKAPKWKEPGDSVKLAEGREFKSRGEPQPGQRYASGATASFYLRIQKDGDQYKVVHSSQKTAQGGGQVLKSKMSKDEAKAFAKRMSNRKGEIVVDLTEAYESQPEQLSEAKLNVDERELLLYIENDGDLYRQRHMPIIKNFVRKLAAGKYDHRKAIDGFMYLVDDGAAKYNEQIAGGKRSMTWISKSSRRKVAEELVDSFEGEIETGSYTDLVPNMYRGIDLADQLANRT